MRAALLIACTVARAIVLRPMFRPIGDHVRPLESARAKCFEPAMRKPWGLLRRKVLL